MTAWKVIHMTDKLLPLAAMERILKKGAENIRVSEPAKEEIRRVLEEEGIRIAKAAAEVAVHAGRKTIKAEDVKFVKKS